MKKKNGFTLLELLVVVVIIGILASIALPQYRKAKVKAESRQLIVSLKALAEAQQRYYLVNNQYATSFSSLDVDFSGYPKHSCPKYQGYFNIADCISNDKSVLWISNGTTRSSFGMFNDERYLNSGFWHNHKKIKCYDNGEKTKLCVKVFSCTFDSSSSSGSNRYYDCPDL